MRYILLILGLVMVTSIDAQEVDKKEKRRLEKEKREQELKKKYEATVQFVENKQFVLEANYLQDRYGNRVSVNSTINFIYVDSDEAILQIGSNSGAGYNGVGGFTIEGKINRWEMKRNDKNKNIRVNMDIMGSAGIYQVTLSISPDRQTSAVLTSITSGRLEYSGNLVALDKSRVYKAKTTY
ncbi:MAG TPA: DUF4251 domain-containing protein [Bacteroidales bacterium]|nr:DUF4251 domain-containing protein [Bacteroidales bacterium]